MQKLFQGFYLSIYLSKKSAKEIENSWAVYQTK